MTQNFHQSPLCELAIVWEDVQTDLKTLAQKHEDYDWKNDLFPSRSRNLKDVASLKLGKLLDCYYNNAQIHLK